MSGCSGSRESAFYQDVASCIKHNPAHAAQCSSAYEDALDEVSRSGPRYRQMADCTAEFGVNQCIASDSTPPYYMPKVGGFLLQDPDDDDHYNSYYHPSTAVLVSHSTTSPLYGRYTTVDGSDLGRPSGGRFSTPKSVFSSKPAVTRTISRGGFGSSVVAKSRSSSSSSWSFGS
ncbi:MULTISPECIES: DUF1190 domain-containing protein [unclassified Halomonas]|uniref:DUF1190 domain-containing protein n=1 Tax=unclassified Halomonas TaxID=2609666 RepID=UPI001C98942D|nr:MULTISPECIES: DUF1190 domain-containing protein [unclassified Halomonas]MBY5926143.1 DUF1190 domain-containing protein [Halomonas sp. DP4Y7-2]MBY6233185.1 DUF1190 domain-containing protein [Halomonas sp. DP4Y7-1]